jgi:hypothetical protein
MKQTQFLVWGPSTLMELEISEGQVLGEDKFLGETIREKEKERERERERETSSKVVRILGLVSGPKPLGEHRILRGTLKKIPKSLI